MLRHGLRVSVAILTFTIGMGLVWALGLVPRLETALVDRFFAVDSNIGPLSPEFVDPVEEATQVYRLVIQQKFQSEESRLIVLNPVTAGCGFYEDETIQARMGQSQPFLEWARENIPEAESQTLDDYMVKNKTTGQLTFANLGMNYAMFSQSDFPRDDVYDFWSRFDQKYPHSSGLISFSNVGFNIHHTQAFVYGGYMCGGLCGAGYYFLLQKVNGRWQIISEQNLWVS